MTFLGERFLKPPERHPAQKVKYEARFLTLIVARKSFLVLVKLITLVQEEN
jgi:hypothetical protein